VSRVTSQRPNKIARTQERVHCPPNDAFVVLQHRGGRLRDLRARPLLYYYIPIHYILHFVFAVLCESSTTTHTVCLVSSQRPNKIARTQERVHCPPNDAFVVLQHPVLAAGGRLC
jgi:hypothetical protein